MNLQTPNRSHWLSIINNLRKVIFELIVFIIFIGNVIPWYILIPGTLVILIVPILQWRKKVFYISNGMLISEGGVIFKEKQEIPIDKITTIDSEQGLILKIFNVCKLKIDSGAASAGKAELEVTLALSNALEFKSLLLKDVDSTLTIPIDSSIKNINSIKISLKDIIIYALTKSKLAWILGLTVVIGQLDMFISDELISKIESSINSLIDTLGNTLSNTSLVIVVLSICIIVLLAYILSTIISIILEIIKFYDFTVYEDNNKIHIEYGLITTRKYSIPLEKLQAIRMKQSLLQQIFGYYNLEVVAIGYGDEGDNKIPPILYPIANKVLINKILDDLLPKFSAQPEVHVPPKKALIKFILKRTLITALIISPLCYILISYNVYISILILILMVIWQLILGIINYKNTSLAIDSSVIIASSGSTRKLTYIIPQENIQSIQYKQTPFQRKSNLCKCNLDICTNTFGEIISVNHIENTIFNELEDSLSL